MPKKDSSLTREIPLVSMRAAVAPASINEESRTVDVTWTTGEKVLRSSWLDGQFYEELSLDPKHVRMDRLNSGRAPFLANHDSRSINSVIGVIESATIGSARVRFAKDDPDADAAWNKVRQGILPNVSVGYRIHKFEKVEGGDEEIPTYRATDWQPFEVSLVPMGADSAAKIRSSTDSNSCIFIGERNMPEKNEKTPGTELPATNTEVTRAVDLEAVKAEAIKSERERVSGITAAVRAAKLEETFASKLVDGNVSLADARTAVLNELATRSDAVKTDNHVRIEFGASDTEQFRAGVQAWMFEKAGNGLVKEAKARRVDGFENVSLDGGQFRGASLLDIARICLDRAGISNRHIYSPMTVLNLALGKRGGASTSDFPVLFENVMFKQMRAAYAVQPHTWKRVCGTDTVSNFLTHNRFLNGSFGTLPVVEEGGEYKSKSVPDGAKNTISTETRGAKITLTRQSMINDDMGALSDVSVRFGASAGRSIDSAFYTLLGGPSANGLGPLMADGQPFFHSNRANVSTSAALTAAALVLDRAKMREQKDISSNDWLDLTPSILLLPIALESAAAQLNNDQFDPAQTGQKSNPVRGMFQDIVSSPRLSWSTTRRYLFTAGKEAFKVVFLEGTGEGPVMESEEDFNTDGLSWKARIDFKVNPYDPKTAITNAGT